MPQRNFSPTFFARTLCVAGAILFLSLTEIFAEGDDIVTFLCTEGTEILTGTIESITGRDGVTCSDRSGAKRTVSMTRVLDLQTDRNPSHLAAEKMLHDGIAQKDSSQISAAIPLFRQARREENRNWAKPLITARLIDALVALGDYAPACEEFFLLAQTDTETPYLASIPLAWRGNVAFTGMTADVETLHARLAPTNDSATRLLAASMLLAGKYRAEAIAVLGELAILDPGTAPTPDSAEFRRSVALLAMAQLWRLRLLVTPKPAEITAWRQALEKFPKPLAAGPTFVVAQGLQRLGETAAADELLRKIEILYPAFVCE